DGIRDDLVTGVQTCALPISDAVLSGAVKIDNFNWIDLRLPGNLLEIESKLRLVTNRYLDQARARVSLLATPAARERFVDFLCERSEERRVVKGLSVGWAGSG